MKLRSWIGTACAIVLMASCSGNNAQREAAELLRMANECYEQGQYGKALAVIDSLRRVYPNALETRRKALSLYQSIALKEAQEDLARTDSMLQSITHDYVYQKTKVDKDRAELRATEQELQMLNETKVRMDSLKVRFDVQCAKIRYIHKKQKEN